MKKVTVILLVLLLIGIFGYWKNLEFGNTRWVQDSISYEKAKVVEVISEELDNSVSDLVLGYQELKVQLRKTDEVLEIKNILSYAHSIYVKKGSNIIVRVDAPEGIEPYYSIYNYDRVYSILKYIALFFLILFIIGKLKGIKSAVALVCSIFVIMFFMIPQIYNGANPIGITILTSLLCSIYSIVILYGFTKMSLINLISIPSGFIIGALFFYLMSKTLHITGFQLEDSEALILIMQENGLQIQGLLFSMVAISSLGAAMDVSVSISSSLGEIFQLNDKSSFQMLFNSGMNIGKDILGTMVNTLIFAFLGGALTTILVLISYGIQFNQLISSDFLAVELIRGFIGTGVVMFMVPITSFIAANTYTHSLKSSISKVKFYTRKNKNYI